MQTPINRQIVKQEIDKMGLTSVGLASIRELNRIVNNIETATGDQFIRMEMGVPGLAPPQVAVDAEIDALKQGVGSKYPPFDGIPSLKPNFRICEKLCEYRDSGGILLSHCRLHAGLLHGHDVLWPADTGKGPNSVHRPWISGKQAPGKGARPALCPF